MSEADSTLRRIGNARKFAEERIKTAKTLEDREDAEDLKNFVESLVTQMCEYTESVFRDNSIKARRDRIMKEMGGSDFRDYCENIDRSRKISHDALIKQVRMTDSLCEEMGIEPIYGRLPEKYKKDSSLLMGKENRGKEGVVEVRHAIADWAWDVTIASTVGMYIDVDSLNYAKNKEDLEKVSDIYQRKIGNKTNASKMIKEITDFEEK